MSNKKKIILAFLVMLGICLGFMWYKWCHPDAVEQFIYLFGDPIPAGVDNVTALRRGVFPDWYVLLRFRVDRDALAEIVESAKLERDDTIKLLKSDDRHSNARIWKSVFGDYFQRAGWEAPFELNDPEVYFRLDHPEITTIKILWDPKSKEAFVLYLVG